MDSWSLKIIKVDWRRAHEFCKRKFVHENEGNEYTSIFGALKIYILTHTETKTKKKDG